MSEKLKAAGFASEKMPTHKTEKTSAQKAEIAPILKIENAGFAYKGGPQILSDINLEVNPGEIVAVLGPNGAGKTTLLRCMMDMLHWDSGRSLLLGEDIRQMPAAKLWRRMAYVPQAKSAAASYTAFQTVLLGRSSRIAVFASPKEEDMQAAEDAMKRLGIMQLADKPCHAISGGELQMVLIARAIAAEADVLVLDEPESNLDFKNQLVVLDAVSALAAEGKACVFNTHYPAHALQRADKSMMLFKDGGSLFGPTTQIVTEENIRRAFGVNAVIGEHETDEKILRNVMPVSISDEVSGTGTGAAAGSGGANADTDADEDGSADCLASISIISKSNEDAGKINTILRQYNHLIAGRMGQPHRKYGLYIINVTLDGKRKDIEELSHRLSILPETSIKTTYAVSD